MPRARHLGFKQLQAKQTDFLVWYWKTISVKPHLVYHVTCSFLSRSHHRTDESLSNMHAPAIRHLPPLAKLNGNESSATSLHAPLHAAPYIPELLEQELSAKPPAHLHPGDSPYFTHSDVQELGQEELKRQPRATFCELCGHSMSSWMLSTTTVAIQPEKSCAVRLSAGEANASSSPPM